jgi:hypothetical protein
VVGRRWRVRELGRVWVVGDEDGLCGAVRCEMYIRWLRNRGKANARYCISKC